MENDLGALKPERAIRVGQKHGEFSDQNMYWSWGSGLNFGDWIGPYVFKKVKAKRRTSRW